MSICFCRESRRLWRELGKVKLTWRYCRDTLCSRTVVAPTAFKHRLIVPACFPSTMNSWVSLVALFMIKFCHLLYLGFVSLIQSSSLSCTESEGGTGGYEGRLCARLVWYAVALENPIFACQPAHSTPVVWPCSCKNANKACVDYDLIHWVAFFAHVQQQFILIFLWVGLCDFPADEHMPVFPAFWCFSFQNN